MYGNRRERQTVGEYTQHLDCLESCCHLADSLRTDYRTKVLEERHEDCLRFLYIL